MELFGEQVARSATRSIGANLVRASALEDRYFHLAMNKSVHGDTEWLSREEAALNEELDSVVKSLRDQLGQLLELVGLPASRKSFLAAFKRSLNDGDVDVEWYVGENYQGPYCRSLGVVRRHSAILTSALEGGPVAVDDARQEAVVEQLSHMMHGLPGYLSDLGIVPTKESDIQTHLCRIVSVVFPDYVRSPNIAKPLSKFIPDFGLSSSRVAVEVKYVKSPKSFRRAYRGITEDLSGYAGSRDWTRFVSFVYMNGSHGNPKTLNNALGAHGTAGRWSSVVVAGPGE